MSNLYIASEVDRDAWSTSIREARLALLISLNIIHPNSTLASSASNQHIRRSLQALPFDPTDERLGAIREQYLAKNLSTASVPSNSNELRKEKRAHVDHWVPAIWIPDGKTDGCMRCGKRFGWRRRRHHCRLCGRCVCHACSSKVSSRETLEQLVG
jgi:FYVE, RhoGEF and PH domain containing 5/6